MKYNVCLQVFDSKTNRWHYQLKAVSEEALKALKEVQGNYLVSYSKVQG